MSWGPSQTWGFKIARDQTMILSSNVFQFRMTFKEFAFLSLVKSAILFRDHITPTILISSKLLEYPWNAYISGSQTGRHKLRQGRHEAIAKMWLRPAEIERSFSRKSIKLIRSMWPAPPTFRILVSKRASSFVLGLFWIVSFFSFVLVFCLSNRRHASLPFWFWS